MYFINQWGGSWVIHKDGDDHFLFGPFTSEGDAYFICEMLNNGKLHFNKGDDDGKENIEEPNTIY